MGSLALYQFGIAIRHVAAEIVGLTTFASLLAEHIVLNYCSMSENNFVIFFSSSLVVYNDEVNLIEVKLS